MNLKEIKIEQKAIDSNIQKLPKDTLQKAVKRQSRKKFVFLLVFGFVFAIGSILLFVNRELIFTFIGSNICIGTDCDGGGGLIDSIVDEPELKQSNGRTNVLLVGIDTRRDQPGLMNTDTIMLVSYDHNSGRTFMISLPRDLYVKIPAIYPYRSRINSVYAQGVKDGDHDTGMDYLKQVVEEITGLPIHYKVMINYDGFLQVIDEVGGVEIEVETEFWGQYPNGEDWEQVHFESGWQHMDGETALKYARTRYANSESGEASDFARAKRQQKVIMAVKDKALSIETLANPIRLTELAKIVGNNIQTSTYNQEDIRAGIKILQSLEDTEIFNFVLEPTVANGQLIYVIPGDAYLLGPTSDSWSQVSDFIAQFMESPELIQEDAKIYAYNGGAAPGAAGVIVNELTLANELLTVYVGGNTRTKDFVGTTIYDFSGGQKPETLKVLLGILPDAEIITEIPETVDNAYNEEIVIIVGADEVEEGMEQV